MNEHLSHVLVLPHLKVQNANAMSSPFTIGFPAMTACLGAVHALQRFLNKTFPDVKFVSTAIISHDIELQTYKGEADYVHSIIGTANPLIKKDGSYERPPFIEEARCHLDVSLVIECEGVNKKIQEEFLTQLSHRLHASMRFAGGDILNFKPPFMEKINKYDEVEIVKLLRQLMPGYVLIERRELLQEVMHEGCDAMDALLECLAVHHRCQQVDKDTVNWTSQRSYKGWLVPIATGFHGISELSSAKNQRDPSVPHRFAESVITLGEFRMPTNFKSLDDIFWHYHVDVENNLYHCQQNIYK